MRSRLRLRLAALRAGCYPDPMRRGRPIALLPILVGLLAPLLAGTAAAQPAGTEAFRAACRANPALGVMARNEPAALAGLCDCLARDFAVSLGPDEIELLRRDLAGEVAPAERADPAFAALDAYAGGVMGACLALEGLVEGRARLLGE